MRQAQVGDTTRQPILTGIIFYIQLFQVLIHLMHGMDREEHAIFIQLVVMQAAL